MASPGFTNPINQYVPKVNVSNPADILDSIKSQLFPSIHMSATVELAVAVVLCMGGVLCMLFGYRFLRVFIATSAFVYVTVISAYATHNLLSTTSCEIYVKRDELCPWGVIAGMVLGLLVAGATARAENAAVIFTGAAMGAVVYFFVNPLVQSVPRVPSWFPYMGFFFFMVAGAAAAKRWKEQFSITLSSVVGAAVLLLSLSHFIQDGLLIKNFSGSLSSPCHSTACWLVIFACIVLCITSVVFQTKWAQRRAFQENGEGERAAVNDVISVQNAVLEMLAGSKVLQTSPAPLNVNIGGGGAARNRTEALSIKDIVLEMLSVNAKSRAPDADSLGASTKSRDGSVTAQV